MRPFPEVAASSLLPTFAFFNLLPSQTVPLTTVRIFRRTKCESLLRSILFYNAVFAF